MKADLYRLVQAQLAVIERLRQVDHSLRAARIELGDRLPDDEERLVREAIATLTHAIYRRENDTWRTVAMLALPLSDEQRREIRLAAYRRYYRQGISVRYLIDDVRDGPAPGIWHGDDEDELRALLDAEMGGDDGTG